MTKNKNVYVITAGEYSGYRIITFFSNKKDADKFVSGTRCRVESYKLDAYMDQVRDGMAVYYVHMHRDGSGGATKDVETSPTRGRIFRTFDGPQLVVRVMATNEQHALKIVNEMRAKLLATGDWIEGRWAE